MLISENNGIISLMSENILLHSKFGYVLLLAGAAWSYLGSELDWDLVNTGVLFNPVANPPYKVDKIDKLANSYYSIIGNKATPSYGH